MLKKENKNTSLMLKAILFIVFLIYILDYLGIPDRMDAWIYFVLLLFLAFLIFLYSYYYGKEMHSKPKKTVKEKEDEEEFIE